MFSLISELSNETIIKVILVVGTILFFGTQLVLKVSDTLAPITNALA